MEPAAPSSLPNNLSLLLHVARTLLDYGRHLLGTVRQRAAASSFNTVAAAFGTGNLPTILAHLNRGLLRAEALQRLLFARAATGHDIDIVEPRPHSPQPPPAAPAPTAPAV